MSGRGLRRGAALVVALGMSSAGCGSSNASVDASFGNDDTSVTTPASTSTPAATATSSSTSTSTGSVSTTSTTHEPVTTTVPVTTSPPIVVPASTTTGPPSPSTSTTIAVPTATSLPPLQPVTSIPAATAPARQLIDAELTATNAAFDRLAANNVGASMSVVHGGELVFSRASGLTVDGSPATGDTPFVVASVSKLVVGLTIARLAQQGLVDVNEPVPWGEIGIWPGNGWSDVTLWELMNHSAGVPVARSTWFSGGVECEEHIVGLVSAPPRGHRGTWTYSNGNYCLLGMVIAARTGLALDVAAQRLVFDPIGASGVHLTLDGLLPGDMPHPHGAGVQRLSRLGGAGTIVVSTDDLALAIGRLTEADLHTVRRGVFIDQYGFGHTGTVDGAKACTWWLDGGDTVISATIAGDGRPTGGAVCDLVIPAIATDLGIYDGRPVRSS